MLSAAELAGAAIGAVYGGLTGLTLGWLAAVMVGAVIYSPRVLRARTVEIDVTKLARPNGEMRFANDADLVSALLLPILAVSAIGCPVSSGRRRRLRSPPVGSSTTSRGGRITA